MSINVINVEVKDNPAPFTAPFQFEITFDCSAPGIPDELEWRLTYVGSAQNQALDQELDSVLVGPIAVGRSKFLLDAPAPDASKIPIQDLLDVTAVVLTGHYHEREFIRVGFYVSVQFNYQLPVDEEGKAILPSQINPADLIRVVASEKPRVTRFHIRWSEDTDELLVLVNEAKGAAPAAETEDTEDALAMVDQELDEEDEEDEEDGEEDMEIDLDDE